MTKNIFGLVDFDKTLTSKDTNYFKDNNLFLKNDKNQTKTINDLVISFCGGVYNNDEDIFELIYQQYKEYGINFL